MTQVDALRIQKTCSTKRASQLSLTRVAACIGIIILHTVFAANEYFLETLSNNANIFSRMIENNMMWAVPSFVMVTGALQLNLSKALTYKKLYRKYILRVLIALVACCLIFRMFDMIMDGEGLSPTGLLQAFVELVTGRCWGHLWYLYLLIGLYVLLPFYRMVVTCCEKKDLIYLCGAYGLFVSVIPLIEETGVHIGFYISESLIYPLYLLLGHMIYEKRIRITRKTGVILVLVSTVLILVADVAKYKYSMDIPSGWFGYASPLVIVQSIGVFSLFCNAKTIHSRYLDKLTAIDNCTFGIYLIHMVFVRLLFRYMGINPYEQMPVLYMTGIMISIMIVSFTLVWFLRIVPGVNRIL